MSENLGFRVMSRLTYPQKFLIVISLILMAFSYLVWNFYVQKTNDIKEVNVEIAGNRLERPLRKLMEYLPVHEQLTTRYLKGDKLLRNDVINLEGPITDAFYQLDAINKELLDPLKGVDFPLGNKETNHLQPQELTRSWEQLKLELFEMTPEASQIAHQTLYKNVGELIRLLGDSTGLALDFDFDNYYAMNMTLIQLPKIQMLLSDLSSVGREGIMRGKFSEKESAQLIVDTARLDDSIKDSLMGIGRVYENRKNSPIYTGAIIAFQNFTRSLSHLIHDIQDQLLRPEKLTITLSDFDQRVEKSSNDLFAYWDAAIDQTEKSLGDRKKSLYYSLIIPLLISLLLGLTGLLFGLYVINTVKKELDDLEKMTKSFTEGDLTARAKVYYHDEAGRVAIAFNKMGDHFETVIGELQNLLGAIKRLANGDFSARVEVKDPDSEMGHVVTSFNQMASSFGDIIGQLRDLGINLSTSATQITAASKQQELVITEQEATTREISVTANQISTTAKEFANTMNEVSEVADQTAALASTGKKSLTEMEGIMRQMVDASVNIAAKLAILNEKAGNITSVITTITKVADQTNLLSLNAAIEAEKAGEFGKSFAVIAREIRRLADLTAFATLDIEKIVGEIMNAVNTSVMGVDDFTQEIRTGGAEVGRVSGQLNSIIEQVQVLTSRFESVNQGMQAQAIGAEQINSAISLLNQTAKETSNSLSGFRKTLQQLTIGAADLRGAVEKIKKES